MHPFFLIAGCLVISLVSQLLLKAAMSGFSQVILTPQGLWDLFFVIWKDPRIIFGLGLYGISFFLWLMVLTKLEVSFAYPMMSLGYVLMPFLAALFLGEPLSFLRLSGIFIIVIGVYVVSQS